MVRLEVSGNTYHLFPLVHISKLKRVKTYPDRPRNQLNVEEAYRLDFYEAMLPEDSWERTLDEDEFKATTIMDVRSGRKIRFGRIQRQFLVQWKGSGDPTWVDDKYLNFGALLQDLDRNRVSKNCFEVMQSHEAAVDE